MNMSQKLRFGTAAVIMIAACSDQGSTPVAPVARAATPLGVGAGNPADAGTVTIKRTIEVRDPDQSGVAVGASPRMVKRQQTLSVGSGRVSVRHEDVRTHAALKAKLRTTERTSADAIPVLGLSVPASPTSLRQAVAPWRRSNPVDGESGAVIETEGTGHAPATTIRLVKNGVTTMVVSQQWELRNRQWNLVRRESWTPDGSFREVVEVARSVSATPGSVESSREWAGNGGKFRVSAPSFDLFGDDDCDSCKSLRDAEDAAFESMVLRAAGTALACTLAPTGAAIPACVAAWLLYTDSLLKWDRAVDNHRDCQAKPPPCPKKNPPITDCSRRAAGGQRLAPSFDCGAAGDGGAGSGGAGGSSGSAGHYECTYYYEYDLDTGDVTFSQLLYCTWHAGP